MSKLPEFMQSRSLDHDAAVTGVITTKRALTTHPAAKVGGQIYAVQSALVQNTTVATSFGSVSLPAGALTAGTHIRVMALGTIVGQNSTDTFGVVLKLGSATITTIAARDPATSDVFHLRADILVRSTGGSGAVRAASEHLFAAAGGYVAGAEVVGTASVTVDTTVDNLLDLVGTWSVANAGNVARLDAMTVEIIG
jgi:hypothetical protein